MLRIVHANMMNGLLGELCIVGVTEHPVDTYCQIINIAETSHIAILLMAVA